jgi:dTDP-4-dehydrorhamnose reductase
MNTGRILVTGAGGFLGWNLLRTPWAGWMWTGAVCRNDPELPGVEKVHADLTAPDAAARLLDRVRPDVVLHTAALASPEACEANPDASRRINVEAAARLADGCAARGIRLIFTSTDMVFDGRHPPYHEHSSRAPICVYGRHKAEAEDAILARCPDAAVCRLPLLFGADGPASHNFLPAWIAALTGGKTVTAFTDEFRSPVAAAVAAQGLRRVVERQVRGVIHLGGRERWSRYEFGRLICDVWGADDTLLKAARQEEVTFAAPRPPDTTLDSSRAFALGYDPPSLREQLIMLKAGGRVS